MSDDAKQYLTIDQLCARSGLSPATIHRLKKAGRISFFQPGGKGCRILFPLDAIEATSPVADKSDAQSPGDLAADDQRLSGPRPAWLRDIPSTTSP
jgi:hypothetical protein